MSARLYRSFSSAAGLGVQSDVPHPVFVVDRPLLEDLHLDTQEVPDPFLEHARQRIERRLAAVQAHREIVALVAAPIVRCVLRVEDVQVHRSGQRTVLRQHAGINYNSQFNFPSLPPQIRQQAQDTWGYYAIAAPVSRAYQGSNSPVFAGETIDSAAYFLTSSIFSASVNTVREASNNSGLPPDQLQNPANLPANSKVRQALTALSPFALTVQSANPRDPGAELAPPLLKTAQQGTVFNSVALIDPFGNLLVCLAGVENQSPIRTAFMETTRSYAVMRWTLMNDPDPAVRAQAEQYLTHPKYGTFVFLYAPDPTTPQAVMTFGAYGSTMEGPVPQSYPSNLQYVLLPGNTTAQTLSTLAQNLPPFYTQSVQVAPAQVLSQDLINAVKNGV